jgi:hypothetical protein
MSYNELEEVKQKKLEETAKRKEQRLKDDIKWILSDPRGRRIFWWLFNITKVFETGFMGNSRDAYEWGKQFVGKILLSKVMEINGFKSLDQMYREDMAEKESEKKQFGGGDLKTEDNDGY